MTGKKELVTAVVHSTVQYRSPADEKQESIQAQAGFPMFFFLLSYRAYFLFSPGRNEAHSYSKGIEKVFTPTNTQYRLWSRMSNFGIRILPC